MKDSCSIRGIAMLVFRTIVKDSHSVRIMAILVFFAVFACYLSLSPATVSGRGNVDKEIASGTRMLANFTAWVKHHPLSPLLRSEHGPLPVLLDLPFIKLGKLIVAPDFIMSFQPVVLTAALVTLLFIWLRRFATPGVSLLLTLAGAFGTMLWPYAYIGLETKQSLFIFIAGYLSLARGKIRGRRGLIAFAIICGVAVNLKYTGFVMLPAVGYLVYAQFRDDWRLRWRQALGVLTIIGSFCLLNALGHKFLWDPSGAGAPLLPGWSVDSLFLFLCNIVGVFGSPTKGLFLFAPILAATIWAIPRAWRCNRDIVVYALLVTGCMAGMISLTITPADELWGCRFMHIAIAPLLMCIGAAWPRLEWRKHLPMAALALLGVVFSFLGSFSFYESRVRASADAHQNTIQWLTGDFVWNEIAFNARAFSVWRSGGSPTPWIPFHIWWILAPPPGAEPWKTIDLQAYCKPQSFLLQWWDKQPGGTSPVIFRMYMFSLILGIMLLVLVVIKTIPAERLQESRSHGKWDSITRVILYCIAITVLSLCFLYCTLRALHPDHWSLWALGDAQTIIAGRHFADEGFSFHYFLPMVSPGFFNDWVGNNGPTDHYAHYPSLFAIIVGLIMKISSHWLFLSKFCVISFVCLGYASWYFFIRNYLSVMSATVALIYSSISTVALSFIDSLCNQGYDIFYRLSIIPLLFFSYDAQSPKLKKGLWYLLWVLFFLCASNTIEPLPLLCIFVFLFYLIIRPQKSFFIAVIESLKLISAPLIALLIHFFQAVASYKGASRVISDWSTRKPAINTAYFGSVLSRFEWPHFSRHFLMPAVICCGLLFVLTILGMKIKNADDKTKLKHAWKILLCLAVATPIFDFFYSEQSWLMNGYMYLQYYPLYTLFLAMMLFHLEKLAGGSRRLYFLPATVFLAIVFFPCNENANYISQYPHAKMYTSSFWVLGGAFTDRDYDIGRSFSRFAEEKTSYGDIIFVPQKQFGVSDIGPVSFVEAWSNRRMMGDGDSVPEFNRRMNRLLDYKKHYPYDRRVSGLEIYALTIPGYTSSAVESFLKKEWLFIDRENTSFGLFEIYKNPKEQLTQ
jgi:hypothetical protein